MDSWYADAPSAPAQSSISGAEAAALARVARDLRVEPSELDPVRVTVTDHEVKIELRGLPGKRLACGPRESLEELTWRFADQLQEYFLEAGEVRPACPGHPHPLDPVFDGVRAEWVCPKDDSHLRVPIGELQT